MSTKAILRSMVLSSAALCLSLGAVANALAQDVGIDPGGAGLFRAKNPETKKSAKPATGTKPPSRTTGPARPSRSNVAERVEDLLDKGNEARDARKFVEAEDAYKEVLKLKPRDARAAYGLGNVYSDQQRWADAEAAYRNSVTWAPTNADAHVALSVVLVQPRADGDNAKRFADAEAFARKSVQIDPKNALGWDRLGVALASTRPCEQRNRAFLPSRDRTGSAVCGCVCAPGARAQQEWLNTLRRRRCMTKQIELAKDPATLNLIADSLQGEQLWPQSEPVLKKALELDRNNPTSLLLMGRFLVVYKRYQEAEPYLKSATEVSSRAFQPFNLLARAYLGMDRFSDAEATYERASAVAGAGEKKQLAGAIWL